MWTANSAFLVQLQSPCRKVIPTVWKLISLAFCIYLRAKLGKKLFKTRANYEVAVNFAYFNFNRSRFQNFLHHSCQCSVENPLLNVSVQLSSSKNEIMPTCWMRRKWIYWRPSRTVSIAISAIFTITGGEFYLPPYYWIKDTLWLWLSFMVWYNKILQYIR